jgi:mono/diheme cytochrome c family protein
MKRTITIAILVAAGAVLATLSVTAKSTNIVTKQQQVARGQYLVTIGGCNDCHTPLKLTPKGPEPDLSRILSGHPQHVPMPSAPKLPEGPWLWTGSATNTAFAGPWGVSFARNLTPDETTGIGIWSEEMFINTIRSGKHWGVARPIMPPMPWFNYAKMSDEDLRSVYAYLRTIKPVKNQVPDAVIAK